MGTLDRVLELELRCRKGAVLDSVYTREIMLEGGEEHGS